MYQCSYFIPDMRFEVITFPHVVRVTLYERYVLILFSVQKIQFLRWKNVLFTNHAAVV